MRALWMIAVLTAAVPDRPNPTPQEVRPPQELILGDWLFVGAGKEPDPNTAERGLVWRILPGEAVWIEQGKPSPNNGFTNKINIDWTKNPVAIDFEKIAVRGIMKLDGDRLSLTWSLSETRPTDFAAGPHICHFTRVRK
jgi:uncharacterized protein (TIGR03067 family)